MPVVLEEFGSKLDVRCGVCVHLTTLSHVHSRACSALLCAQSQAMHHSPSRAGQYQLAYDSCLADAKRQGSCAGVMFWDLTHTVWHLPLRSVCSEHGCSIKNATWPASSSS